MFLLLVDFCDIFVCIVGLEFRFSFFIIFCGCVKEVLFFIVMFDWLGVLLVCFIDLCKLELFLVEI